MRSIQKAAWLSVMLAVSSLAQEEAAEIVPPEPPRWSVGAGVGFGYYGLIGGAPILGGGVWTGLYSYAASPVSTNASLEYALTQRVSVTFGVAGAYSEWEPEPPRTPEEPITPMQKGYSGALALGARAFLNTGPTRVSVHAIGFVSLAETTNGYWPRYPEEPAAFRHGAVGATAGFAVDHVLFERLSLRASTNVATIGVSFRRALTQNFRPVPGSEARTGFGAGVQLSPGFELRLAF